MNTYFITNFCKRHILSNKHFSIHNAFASPIGKIFITQAFEKELELFKHILEIAHLLETKYIRMFSFFIPKGESPEVYREEVLKRWQAYCEAAKGKNITLLHENEKDIYGDTIERCYDLLTSLDCPYVKDTFDFANFIQVGEDTRQAYETLKDFIAYVYIKDATKTGEVVPAVKGIGEISVLLKKLKDKNYEGYLSIEPHLGSFKGLEKFELSETFKELPEGGEKLFAIAVEAFREIEKEIMI